MNASRAGPKSHHYVPAAYLARFTDVSGFMHVYDRARKQIRRQRPNKVMKIDAYYRQAWAPAGVDVNIFETSLGAGLEARVPAIFNKLAHSQDAPTEDEAVDLLMYLEVQRLRVPRQAKMGIELMRGVVVRSLPADVAAEVTAGRYQLTMKDSARFDFMRMAIGTVHPWLGQMEWEVVAAEPGSGFLTSDSPVCFYNPRIPPPAEAGIGLAGTKVFFPLSSTHLLLMRHPDCQAIDPLAVLAAPTSESWRVPLVRGKVWPASTVASTNFKIAALAGDLIAAASAEILLASEWEFSDGNSSVRTS